MPSTKVTGWETVGGFEKELPRRSRARRVYNRAKEYAVSMEKDVLMHAAFLRFRMDLGDGDGWTHVEEILDDEGYMMEGSYIDDDSGEDIRCFSLPSSRSAWVISIIDGRWLEFVETI